MTIGVHSPSFAIITLPLPFSALGTVGDQPGVQAMQHLVSCNEASSSRLDKDNLAETLNKTLNRVQGYGGVTSQGVQLHEADHWHTAGYNGNNITIGILDRGFAGLDRLSDGLSGNNEEFRQTRLFGRCYSGLSDTSPSIGITDCVNARSGDKHGTAVTEVVVDMAPDDATIVVGNPAASGTTPEAKRLRLECRVADTNGSRRICYFSRLHLGTGCRNRQPDSLDPRYLQNG